MNTCYSQFSVKKRIEEPCQKTVNKCHHVTYDNNMIPSTLTL